MLIKKGFNFLFVPSGRQLIFYLCHFFNIFIFNQQAVAFFFFFFFTVTVQSQSLVYKNYTVNDGLCGQTVYYSFEDSKGFMWFATDAGVSRFDGVHFQNFNTQDGLSDNEVHKIIEDSKGRIWFLTSNGKISYLQDNVFHNPSNDTLAKQVSGGSAFFECYKDNFDNLWFSTYSGAIIRVKKNNSVKKFTLPVNVKTRTLYGFYETPDNELWIIGNKMFYKYDNGSFIPLSGPVIKSGERLPFYFISKGNALLLSDNGLERLINKNYGVIIPSAKIPFNDKTLGLYYTARNDIWITNQKDQTLYFKYDSGMYLPVRTYLKGNAIIFVYTDREENTWFCSAGNGVFKLPAQSFSNRSYTVEDGLSYNNVTTVKMGNDSSLWLGFSNGIINRLKQNKIEIFDCNFTGKNNNRILQIETDAENNIWAATDDGVALIKKIYEKKYAPPFHVKIDNSDAPYSCKSMCYDSSGHLTVSWLNGVGEIWYTDDGYEILPWNSDTLFK
ncbi:MAG: two-component regulator propeller domain-containing protein, partial [Bacteroidia bacterium]